MNNIMKYMALSAALIAGLGSCDFLEQTENTCTAREK